MKITCPECGSWDIRRKVEDLWVKWPGNVLLAGGFLSIRSGGRNVLDASLFPRDPVWGLCSCTNCGGFFDGPEKHEPEAMIDKITAKEGGFYKEEDDV